jgi:PEP-CTERM motif
MRGGALVKFAKVLALVVVLGCSAVVAHADASNDPTVKVNKFPDPTCPPTDSSYSCFSENSQADPLMIPVGSDQNFVWDGAGALTTLFVEFPFNPSELYTCESNIFAVCGTVYPSVNQSTDAEFEFEDGSIAPCTVGGDCTGVTAGVPEPSSALLLFAGLICLLAFARKQAAKQPSGPQRVFSV